MGSAFRENLVEAAIGVLVLAVAAWFVVFSYDRTQGGEAAGSYHVLARFPNASGVTVGTDVRVSGLKIGTVTQQKLDPESYDAVLTLSVDPKIKLPLDSSAAITSEGILGGNFISLRPGAETDMLRDGDEITDTSGSIDLMALIGSVVNQTASKAATPEAEGESKK